MYERSYGYRYAELGEHPSAAEIAKAIRADIKQAVGEGLLPDRWTYSVRSDHGSTYQSVDIYVQDCVDAHQPCDGGYAHAAEAHEVLTEEAEAARMTLERIHGAYNHDGSEIQVDYFDVRYYGHVHFESADSREFRLREKARLAEKKAARETGEPVGLYVNYSRKGVTVHVAVETAEGPTVLACGARLWRGGVGQRVEFGKAEVTCSRCAKRLAALSG